MQAVKQHLASATGRLEPFRCVTMRLSTDDETAVAPTLQRLSATFKGSVGIGSYPVRASFSPYSLYGLATDAQQSGLVDISTL